MTKWIWAAFAVALAAHAAPAEAAGLLRADGGFGGELKLVEHDVRVTINNGVAVTEVQQVFQNLEARQVEALYTFPVPKAASVSNFSMWIGDKEMVGEVLEKKRAREIYESYKVTRQDPGLLEQTDYRTFEMRIFPIAANAQQRVKLVYYQELDVDHDWASYVYPLQTGTGRGSGRAERMSLDLVVKSEVPIAAFESPSHPKEMVGVPHTPHTLQASLELFDAALDRDLVVTYKLARPRTGIDLITSTPDGEDGYFLMTITAGDDLKGTVAGMDYVFILDVSGSMGEDGKLAMSREQLGAFVRALGPEDRIEMIAFNVAPATGFGRLRAADDAAKAEGARFLAAQQPRGGTNLRPAMEAAYRYKSPDRTLNVVVLSDGLTEQSERPALLQLVGARPRGTRVFCVGVGNDVDRLLLTQLAEDAGGLAAFLSRGDDFGRAAAAFRRKLEHPVATNLELAIEGVELLEMEPAKVPNLFHGQPVRIYGRFRGSGKAAVTVKGDLGGERFEQKGSLVFAKSDDDPEIERMWAYQRVQRLLKEAERAGSRDAVIPEIVRLGEAFSIVTEYTSFLVLENDAEYQRWKIERRNALRVQRDGKKQASIRAEIERLSIDAARRIGPADRGDPALAPAPAPGPAGAPTPRVNAPTVMAPRPSRGLDFGGRGGGGAIDPVTGLVAAGMAAAAWRAARRRRP